MLIEALSRLQMGELRGFAAEMVHSRLKAFCDLNDLANISTLQAATLRDQTLAEEVCRYVSLQERARLSSDALFNALHYAATSILRSSPWPTIWLSECADPNLVGRVLSMLQGEGLSKRARVFVTHSNERILTETMALALPTGAGSAGDLGSHVVGENAPDQIHDRVATPVVLLGDMSSNTIWAQHDLMTDGSFNEFNVIVCCRPLNAYTPAVQVKALALFAESLSNFGILQIEPFGEVHSNLINAFSTVLCEQGVYRKTPGYDHRSRLHTRRESYR